VHGGETVVHAKVDVGTAFYEQADHVERHSLGRRTSKHTRARGVVDRRHAMLHSPNPSQCAKGPPTVDEVDGVYAKLRRMLQQLLHRAQVLTAG